MHRRDFLTATGVGVLAALARPAGAPLPPVGLHLPLQASRPPGNLEPVLRQVAAAGYREVELWAGEPIADPAAVRRLLDAAGLAATSHHVPMAALFTNWKLVLRECQALGTRHLVCAEVPPAQRATLAGYERVIELLNAAATVTTSFGLTLAVHPHADDFRARDGVVPFERLVAGTHPARVRFQLDLALLAGAGRDPAAEIRRLGARLASVHVNNVAAATGEPADLEAGRLDLPQLLGAAVAAGVTQFYVDDPRGLDARAAAQLAYLRALDL